MSKKGIEVVAKELEDRLSKFPDWYWKYGLHDSVILSVLEYKLVPDWNEKNPKRNCLEIELDSRNALYQNNIQRIYLYNYTIKTTEFDISDIEEPWWVSDTIVKLPNDYYLLKIELGLGRNVRRIFTVKFEFAEIENR